MKVCMSRFFLSIWLTFVTGDFPQEISCVGECHENQSVTQMLNNECFVIVSLCQSVIQMFNNNFVGLLHENQAVIAIFYVNKWLCVRIFQIDLPDLLDIRYNKVLRWLSSFGSIHQVMFMFPCLGGTYWLHLQSGWMVLCGCWSNTEKTCFCSKQGMRQSGDSLLQCAENLQDYSEPEGVRILIITIIWRCENCVESKCCQISVCC